MTEKELIFKIGQLKEIKPSQNWANLIKEQILGKEQEKISWLSYFQPFFRLKPGYISLVAIFILFGLFGVTQNSLPGDLFYPVKKIVEKSQVLFVSEEQKTEYSLESANKRLEELTKIAQTNQVEKLAPALEEYQASIVQVAKNLTKITSTTSDPTVIKKLAEQTQKLEENKTSLEQTYGIAGLENEEGSSPIRIIVEWLVKDLEKRTLNEEQTKILDKMKELTDEEEYLEALILFNTEFDKQVVSESAEESVEEVQEIKDVQEMTEETGEKAAEEGSTEQPQS